MTPEEMAEAYAELKTKQYNLSAPACHPKDLLAVGYLAGLSACACGPWISTKERLPDHDKEVLIWCEEEAYIAYFDSTKQWNGLGLPEDSNLVTHWAELGGRMPTEKEPKATELREPKG